MNLIDSIRDLIRRVGECERRIFNLIRLGTILEADYSKPPRVRVEMGDNVSARLPFVTDRAGGDSTWHPPEVGEQVVVLAPCGELAAGVVALGGINKQDRPANGDKPTISRTTYADGAVIEYDRETHVHAMTIPAGGKTTVRVGENASTEITESKIIYKLGTDAQTEITASQITHKLGGGKIIITVDGVKISSGGTSLNIDSGGIIIKGTVTIVGSVTQFKGALRSNGIALHSHTHGGITSGPAVTAIPNP